MWREYIVKTIIKWIILFGFINNVTAEVEFESFGLFFPTSFQRVQMDQWLELKNMSDGVVDLSGYKIIADNEILYTFPNETILQPQGKVRINFYYSLESMPPNGIFRKYPILTPKILNEAERGAFVKKYEEFRFFRNEEEKKKLYSNLESALFKVPIVFSEFYIRNKNGINENSVLITNIYINNKRDFDIVDLTQIGLMPVTILVKEGSNFVNHQALVLPKTFEVRRFYVSQHKLVILTTPFYLLAEQNMEVKLQFYKDKEMTSPVWSKTSPIKAGTGILITPEDQAIFREFASQPVYFQMQLFKRNYQSDQVSGCAQIAITTEK